MSYESNEGPEEGFIENPFAGAQQQTMDTNTLLQQTNPSPVLQEIEHQLNGEIYDIESESWKQIHTPLMNQTGLNKIMATLRSVVNTNCILSNLTLDEVKQITLGVADSLTLDICANYKEYGIAKSDFDRVISLCTNMCFFSLKRSYMEGERRFLKTTFRHTESNIQRNQQQQPGGWQGFFSRNKK